MGTLRVFHLPSKYFTALITKLRLTFSTKQETNTFLIKKWKCPRKLRGVSMFKPKYLLEMNWSIKVRTASFPLTIFSVNVAKSAENCESVTFAEEILNIKFPFSKFQNFTFIHIGVLADRNLAKVWQGNWLLEPQYYNANIWFPSSR